MSIIPSIFGHRTNTAFDPFSLDIWDPIQDFPFTFDELEGRETSWADARIDSKETLEAHVFKVDLPGLNKDDMKVELEEGRVLRISGEKSRDKEEKDDMWHHMERSVGKFLRRFRLPGNTKTEEMKAGMENGVLTVTVPKEEVKNSELKSIDISV